MSLSRITHAALINLDYIEIELDERTGDGMGEEHQCDIAVSAETLITFCDAFDQWRNDTDDFPCDRNVAFVRSPSVHRSRWVPGLCS
jgi:hypothetical protein